jgi:hypothetical protein
MKNSEILRRGFWGREREREQLVLFLSIVGSSGLRFSASCMLSRPPTLHFFVFIFILSLLSYSFSFFLFLCFIILILLGTKSSLPTYNIINDWKNFFHPNSNWVIASLASWRTTELASSFTLTTRDAQKNFKIFFMPFTKWPYLLAFEEPSLISFTTCWKSPENYIKNTHILTQICNNHTSPNFRHYRISNAALSSTTSRHYMSPKISNNSLLGLLLNNQTFFLFLFSFFPF